MITTEQCTTEVRSGAHPHPSRLPTPAFREAQRLRPCTCTPFLLRDAAVTRAPWPRVSLLPSHRCESQNNIRRPDPVETLPVNCLHAPSSTHIPRAPAGTSMAAPAVAAAAALVRQYFMAGFYPSGQANEGDAITPSGGSSSRRSPKAPRRPEPRKKGGLVQFHSPARAPPRSPPRQLRRRSGARTPARTCEGNIGREPRRCTYHSARAGGVSSSPHPS